MAKSKSSRKKPQSAVGTGRSASSQATRKWVFAVILTVIVVAGCGYGGHRLWPDGLPAAGQRAVGLLCAALATATLVLSSYRKQSIDEMAHRMRRGQHADFGKLLRMANAQDKKVKLPLLGETSPRTLAGVGTFVLVAGWWLSPLAPVAIRRAEVQDLGIPLREEIAAVVLVMPNAHSAVLQPPLVSPLAAKLAGDIDEGNDFELGRKAVGEGRFDDARRLLETAGQNGDAPLHEVYAVLAQNELYAGRYTEGVEWYEKALAEKADNPLLLAQTAAARLHVGGIPQLKKAEKNLDDALALFDEDASDPTRAVCLHVQTVLWVCQGKKLDAAVQQCHKAGKILDEVGRPKHACRAAVFNNQGVIYLLQARYTSGGEMCREANETWSDSVGANHPHVAAGLGNVAMARHLLAHDDEARELLAQAAEIRAAVPEAAPARARLTAIDRSVALVPDLALNRAAAESAAALQRGEEALALAEGAFDGDHPVKAAVYDSLGALYAAQARFVKARTCYDRARGTTVRSLGGDHPFVAAVLNHRARLSFRRARLGGTAEFVREQSDQAETDAKRARDLYTSAIDKEHAGVADALTVLGGLSAARQAWSQAEPDLIQAKKIQEKVYAEELPDGSGVKQEHPALAQTIGGLAALKNSFIVYTDGAEEYAEAIAMAEAVRGAEHPETAALWYGLAMLYRQVGKTGELRQCLDKARAVQEQPLAAGDGRQHPDLALTLDAYAELLKLTDAAAATAMEAEAAQIRSRQAEVDQQDKEQ